MVLKKQNGEKGKRIIICHGTIDAVFENYKKAVKMTGDKPVNIYMLSGRTSGNKITDGQPNCHRMPEVIDIAKKGFSPTLSLCLPLCEIFKDQNCPYLEQFENLKFPGLCICTHKMLASHMMEADEIIFDEDPTDSLIIEVSLGLSLLKELGLGEQVSTALINDVTTAAKEMAGYSQENNRRGLAAYSKPMPGLKDAPLLPKFLNNTDDLQEELKSRVAALLPYFYQETRKQESKTAWQRRLYEDGINMHACRWLLHTLDMMDLLDFEDPAIGWSGLYVGAETNKDGIPVNFRLLYSWRIRVPSEPRMVVLDATAYPPALKALFERKMPITDAQIPLPNYRGIHIQKPFGLMKAKAAGDDKIRLLLETAEGQLLDRDCKVLIITHLAIEERVKNIIPEVFPSREVAVIHFGIARGTNKYEHFDAAILFGNFTMSPFAASRRTVTLLNDEKKCAEYSHFMNEAEDFQSVHRVRPIYGNKTIIVVGRRWPDRLPRPDIVINRKGGAPKSPGGVPETGEAAKAAEVRLGGFLDTFRWLNAEAGNFMLVGRDANLGLLEQYKSWWMREIVPYLGSERVPCLKDIIYILYDRVLGLTPHRASTLSNKGEAGKNPQIDPQIALSILTFTSKSWFSRILEKIQTKHPDLPELLYQHPRGGRPFKGIGTVAGVRKFYETTGQIDQFEPERWEEVGGRGKHK